MTEHHSNGKIDLRKTHATLYWTTTVTALGSLALAYNFFFLNAPTFPVWKTPYAVWGSIFLLLGATQITYLNVRRNVDGARILMVAWVVYVIFYGAGTCYPYVIGEGSLQLPIVYGMLALLAIILVILEPFISALVAARR